MNSHHWKIDSALDSGEPNQKKIRKAPLFQGLYSMGRQMCKNCLWRLYQNYVKIVISIAFISYNSFSFSFHCFKQCPPCYLFVSNNFKFHFHYLKPLSFLSPIILYNRLPILELFEIATSKNFLFS